MTRKTFNYSLLIDVGLPTNWNACFERIRPLLEAGNVQCLAGFSESPLNSLFEEANVRLNGDCQIVPLVYQRSEIISRYSELAFSARCQQILFVDNSSEIDRAQAREIDKLTRSPGSLDSMFFWGSSITTPASYTAFGRPPHATESGIPDIHLLLVQHKHWMKAVSSSNRLLQLAWNSPEWHQTLSTSLAWEDISVSARDKVKPKPAQSEVKPAAAHPAAQPVRTSSELDVIIPPEIKDDEFYNVITRLASSLPVSTILEIGSSSGGGSTEAFVNGIANNAHKPVMYCLEVSLPRFEALQQRYGHLPYVRCLNASSVPVSSFPSRTEVEKFYTTHSTILNNYPLEQVLGWLDQDLRYIKEWEVIGEGIQEIKTRNQISTFDMVLIDGSEFSGEAELERVYGASYILLDDVSSYKNYINRERLLKDSDYELVTENLSLRNGYSVFKKKTALLDRTARDQFLREIVDTYHPRKIIQKLSSGPGVADLLPAELVGQDLCLIEAGSHNQLEALSQICSSRSLRHAVLYEGRLANQAMSVALGRYFYRPDLIVLDGSAEKIIGEWSSVLPQLLKNCLVVTLSSSVRETMQVRTAVSQQCPQLQEVSIQAEAGAVMYYYDHSLARKHLETGSHRAAEAPAHQ